MTILQWLQALSKTDYSNDDDALKMQNLLRRLGFPNAVVLVGIVYPEGSGQPLDIHTMAKMLLPKEA